MFRRKNPGKPPSTPTPPKPSKAGRKLVAVDHVEDGLIYRTDGMIVGVVEVSGIPYDMLQVEEQDQINSQFRGFLHMLTFPVALHILSERWDLSPEIARFQSRLPTDYADTDPAHADQWAQIAHGYAELLGRYTQFLDHVVYWVAVPASTPSQANDHARAVETVLKSLHSDAQPFRPPRDRILMVLANAYGHPLPAPPSAYAAGSVIR